MEKKNDKNKKVNKQYPPNPFRKTAQPQNNWWKYLIGMAAFWLIFSWLFGNFGGGGAANISYTKFKSQAEKGKIAEVTFKGDQISGKFKGNYIVVNSQKDTIKYQYFATVKPAFEDPDLMQVLEKNNVTVNAESTEDNSWLTYLLIMFLPWILIIGYFIYMRKKIKGQMGGGMMGGGLFNVGKSGQKNSVNQKQE